MKRRLLAAIIGAVVIASVASAVYLIEYPSSPSCANQSTQSTSTNSTSRITLGNPVGLDIYLNGSISQGVMSFNVQPGSTSTIIVKTSYPWANVASILPQQCVLVSFTIGPFPANINGSTIPSWLHVSLSAPSIEITYLASPSVELIVTADKTAPRGSAGSFELQAHYMDPASGVSATEDIPISINS